VPDHSTFSKNRHGRFRQSDVFRHVFESVLRRCMSEGLVGGEGFAGCNQPQRRRRRRRRSTRDWQERLPDRSSGELGRCAWWTGVLRLLDQLPDRSGRRDHCGRGGHARASNHGGRVDQDHDRTRRTAVRTEARSPGGRHRLRHRADARLDGQGQRHRSACAGVGQDRAKRRHPVEQRVPMGRAGERVPMPAGTRAAERASAPSSSPAITSPKRRWSSTAQARTAALDAQ
jgi:hypothetical protein